MATPPYPTPPHVSGNKASIVAIGKLKICGLVFRRQLRPRSVRLIIRNPSLDSGYSPREAGRALNQLRPCTFISYMKS